MARPGPPRKLRDRELQDRIIAYVRQYGTIDEFSDPHVLITPQTIYNGVREFKKSGEPNPLYLPEFSTNFLAAKQDYIDIHRHPKDDPTIQRDAFTQFGAGIKIGKSYNIRFEYYEEEGPLQGKIRNKIFNKPGLEKWEYDVLHPKQEFTQEAIECVTGNQYKDILENETLSSPAGDVTKREIVREWLVTWLKRANDDLQKRGLKPVVTR